VEILVRPDLVGRGDDAGRHRVLVRWPRHLAGLAVVLLVLWWTGPRGWGFTTDALALLEQVEAVAEGTWSRPHPYPSVDPLLQHYPDALASQVDGTNEFAPYPKHPFAVVVLVGPWRLAGEAGVELVVLAGLLAAAGAVGAVVERLVRGAGPAALWLVGVGSAVLVHGLVVWWHAWAVALVALAAWGVVDLVERTRRWPLPAAAVGVSVVLLPLLRTEGALLGVALAAGLGGVGLRRRRSDLVAVGAAVVLAVVTTVVAEAAVLERLAGSMVPIAAPASAGLVTDRLLASYAAFVWPGQHPVGGMVRLLSVAAIAPALWRYRKDAPGPVLPVVISVGSALYIASLYLYPPATPGFVTGLPLLVLPFLLPSVPRRPATGALAAAALAYLALVALTAYPQGAGSDWAGRYSVLVLPLLAPLVAERLTELRRRVGGPGAAVVVVALLATSAAAGPAVWSEVRGAASRTRAVEAAIGDAVARTPSAPETGLPVVVTTNKNYGRLLASDPERATALYVGDPAGELGPLLSRLGERRVVEVLLVGGGELLDEAAVAGIVGWEVGPVELLASGTASRTARRV
jgi:hypothetical protein